MLFLVFPAFIVLSNYLFISPIYFKLRLFSVFARLFLPLSDFLQFYKNHVFLHSLKKTKNFLDILCLNSATGSLW